MGRQLGADPVLIVPPKAAGRKIIALPSLLIDYIEKAGCRRFLE
jgi:hypothetical protein